MMRRPFLYLVGLAAVLVAGLWLVRTIGSVNPATYSRIRLGMTLQEVESIIGEPPTGFCTGIVQNDRHMPWVHKHRSHGPEEVFKNEKTKYAYWWSDNYGIHVAYHAENKVIGVYLDRWSPALPSFGQRVRAWLGGWSED